MGFHLLRLIVIIPIVVSAGNSDSTSFLSDGLLFSDIGFSSSSIEEALAFRQPDFSLDSLDSSSDGFDSPFENTNGNFFSTDTVVGLEDTDNSDLLLTNYVDLNDKDNSDFFLIHNTDFEDEPIQMTDCSSSKPSPIIGKSRIRRQDASSDVCPAPGPGPFKSQGVPSDAAGGRPRTSHLDNFSLEWVLTEAEFRKRQNEACNIFTAGTLPWGLCYQPTEVPLQPAGTSVVPPDVRGSPYTSYMVDPGTLGKSKSPSLKQSKAKLSFKNVSFS